MKTRRLALTLPLLLLAQLALAAVAVLPQLSPQDLGEGHHAVLGDAVRAQSKVRDEPGERRREQNMAALPLGDEARQERLDAVDRSPQVDVEHPSPVIVGHLQDGPADGHAGVVEHDVHGAEGVERGVGGFAGQIERLDSGRLAAIEVLREADLDAEHDVPVGLDGLQCFGNAGPFDVVELPNFFGEHPHR